MPPRPRAQTPTLHMTAPAQQCRDASHVPSRGRGALAWLELAAVLLFAATRVHGYGERVDLHPEDETYCLVYGRALFFDGELPPVAWSPAYCAAAGLTSFVVPDDVFPADVLYLAAVAGGALVVWWALRAIVPAPLPVLAAAWWVCLPPVLGTDRIGGIATPNVYGAASALLFTGIGLLARRRYGRAALAACVAAATRTETVLWTAGVAAVGWLVPGERRRRVAWTFTAAAVVSLSVLASWSVRARSWIAFRQHYATRVTERLHVPGGPEPSAAFDEPDAIVRQHFPGADSLLGAAFASPGDFFGFVLENLVAMPAAAAEALVPRGVPWWAVVAVLACAAFGWWRWARGRSGWIGPDPYVLGAALAAPLAVLPSLWVAARPELLLPLFPALALLVLGGLAAAAPLGAQRWPRLAWSGPAGLIVLALVVPGPFAAPAEAELPYRRGVALLRRHELPAKAIVLCDRPACFSTYRPLPGATWVPPSRLDATHGTVGEAIARAGITHVLVNPSLVRGLARFPDVERELEGTGWSELGRDGSSRLLERDPR